MWRFSRPLVSTTHAPHHGLTKPQDFFLHKVDDFVFLFRDLEKIENLQDAERVYKEKRQKPPFFGSFRRRPQGISFPKGNPEKKDNPKNEKKDYEHGRSYFRRERVPSFVKVKEFHAYEVYRRKVRYENYYAVGLKNNPPPTEKMDWGKKKKSRR